ncbi:MAG: S53 family peptidase [Acidimicrobiales bacterium]
MTAASCSAVRRPTGRLRVAGAIPLLLVAGMALLPACSPSDPASTAPHDPTSTFATTTTGTAAPPSTTTTPTTTTLASGPATREPLTPDQLRANYDLSPVYASGITGKGTTIGIVDVFGSPTLRHDLAVFDSHFHLPPPPSFKIVEPAGTVPPFSATRKNALGWAGETTLDVEMAHAIAPGARIVLAVTGVDEVEGLSGFAEIVKAERYLIDSEHVSVISQSFAATEETFPSVASLMALRSVFLLAAQRGVSIVSASGDGGATSNRLNPTHLYNRRVVSWPASDPLVTAVGGTQVSLDGAGAAVQPPSGWSGSGGGISAVFNRPSWQAGVQAVVGDHRGLPDIAMVASCSPGVEIYETRVDTAGSGFGPSCGTSAAAPMFAGIVALADQLAGHDLGLLNPAIYRLGERRAPGIVDVTTGNNSAVVPVGDHTVVVKGYRATTGYDLVTGWGTVDARYFVPELAGRALPPG